MSRDERDRQIIELRRRRWTYDRIAKHLGTTKTVVAKTCQQAIRPEPRQPGDVDPLGTSEEQW